MTHCGWPFETKDLACPVSLTRDLTFAGKA
jgi:hypothetical protein